MIAGIPSRDRQMLLMTCSVWGCIGNAGDSLTQRGGTRHPIIRSWSMKRVHQSFLHMFGAGILFAGPLCIAILLVLKVMQSLAAIIPR